MRKETNIKNILVTGGAGYIGSHTCVELINSGYNVIVVDNLVNGNIQALKRIENLTNKDITFFEVDLRDRKALDNVFNKIKIDSIIHCAGYKAVGESVENPLLYYSNNVSASVNLLEVMKIHNVKNIVFSSSCTVYGKPDSVPVKEDQELKPTNPYGRSKLMVEQILNDFHRSNANLSVSILRYFNPIGAHPSGIIGEDPRGIPNNLLPYVSKVAIGELDELQIFGSDYNTKDGTGVRDYLHVVDLANAHIKALEELMAHDKLMEIYNLGTGQGYSVLDIVKTFEKVSQKKVKFRMVERRPGDVDKTYADPSKANEKLNWFAEKDLDDMCTDIWNWQMKNPNGYKYEK